MVCWVAIMPIDTELPIIVFDGSDRDYLFWTRQNPRGFVVNCYRRPAADYVMLHWADCYTITGSRSPWTTGDFVKVCSPTLSALEEWAEDAVGGELQKCEKCWTQ